MASIDNDDPVFAKSTFLTAYMSNHADTLVAYICYHLEQQKKGKRANDERIVGAGDVKEPKMLKITSKFMILQYKDAGDSLAVKTDQSSVVVSGR
jgi:hypothetical protein